MSNLSMQIDLVSFFLTLSFYILRIFNFIRDNLFSSFFFSLRLNIDGQYFLLIFYLHCVQTRLSAWFYQRDPLTLEHQRIYITALLPKNFYISMKRIMCDIRKSTCFLFGIIWNWLLSKLQTMVESLIVQNHGNQMKSWCHRNSGVMINFGRYWYVLFVNICICHVCNFYIY